MKNKITILANLIQKIAMWKTEFNQEKRLEEHIRMLDWVMSSISVARDIEEIVNDKDYKLSPEDYFKKYN